uniref:WH2 domain-containing protein n=1 Tax=Corethrella appendiculata TaxID=1370023 RepID=W4VRA3_9DIPT
MNGLSTINRLLGKKNKDVSKSTSNLSRSTTNLDSSSQYNKIVPLTAMTNAPFEQTFRITVLLPRDQLYVARIGAKTKLYVLLEMICNDKQLDFSKYEFRHPANYSKIFENELTIGEVGLNEIRLVSKSCISSGVYNSQNSEYRFSTSDIFRYQRNNIRESSLSSSDLSRTSKIAMKTTSPYSSTNSLNSMDSSGMSTSSKGNNNGHSHHQPVVPMRKKRQAPRPPSQNSIPEQETICTNPAIFKEPQLPPYSRKNFHVSSPNLYNQDINYHQQSHFDTIEELNNINNDKKTSYNNLKNRPTSMYIIREPEINTENGNGNILHSRQSSSDSSDIKDRTHFTNNPEPIPRKKSFSSLAKKGKAPAPPPRTVKEDKIPVPSPRTVLRSKSEILKEHENISETDSNFSEDLNRAKEFLDKSSQLNIQNHPNVSKVMLNVDNTSTTSPLITTANSPIQSSTTPTTSTTKTTPTATESGPVSIKITTTKSNADTTTITKSPIISKVHIVPENVEKKDDCSSTSSDDDGKIKVYNIKEASAKTITQLNKETTNNISSDSNEKENDKSPPSPTLWTYTLPAPPNFADTSLIHHDRQQKQQQYFQDDTSMLIENTTMITETVTEYDDLVDRIQPFIKDREIILNSDYNVVVESKDKIDEKSKMSLSSSPSTTIVDDHMSSEMLISSDIEDGYHGGNGGKIINTTTTTITTTIVKNDLDNTGNGDHHQNSTKEQQHAKELLINLEKRREKLIENELEYLAQDIINNDNDSDIVKCAKLNNNDEMVHQEPNDFEKSDLKSIDELNTEIINELNSLISENSCKTDNDEDDETNNKILLNNLKNIAAKQSSAEEQENLNLLRNFKISTYKPDEIQNIVTMNENMNGKNDEEEIVELRRKISGEYIRKNNSSDEDEILFRNGGYSNKKEMAPVKRKSLTILNKSPNSKLMNRSDSFHSTRTDYLQSAANLNLTPRSTSYISLIGAQKWENRNSLQNFHNYQINRRKSTSELSISNSPSLQSLEVMKTILNSSRKNSVNNLQQQPSTTDEFIEEITSMATIKRNSFTDISTLVQLKNSYAADYSVKNKLENFADKIEAVEKQEYSEKTAIDENKLSEEIIENKSKSDDEKLEQNKKTESAVSKTIISSASTLESNNNNESNNHDSESDVKKWKYSGPPTINFTTWNERPKIDVSIKYDKDYKFGGSSTLPRGYRNTVNGGATKITVKPILQEEECNTNNLNSNETTNRLPIVRGVEYKKNVKIPTEDSLEKETSSKSFNMIRQLEKSSYFYDNFSRNTSVTTLNSSTAAPSSHAIPSTTLNRVSLNFNTNKFTPIVKGFKSIDESKEQPINEISKITLRSTSLDSKPISSAQQNHNLKTTMSTDGSNQRSFSQDTLRRTGLKEKILATPVVVEEKPIKAATITNKMSSVPPPPPPQNPKLMPVVRGVVVKKQLPPPALDPRDQLLDSIRNFNKNKLKSK